MTPKFFTYRLLCNCCRVAVAVVSMMGAMAHGDSPVLNASQWSLLATHVRPSYPFKTISKWTVLEHSDAPLPLKEGRLDEDFRWVLNGKELTVTDYLDQQPVSALLIAKDGEILVEAYRYTGSRNSLFLSNSMAKSVLGLGYGFLRRDGLLKDFEASTDIYLKELQGSNLGQITLRNHLRMGSGLAYIESYTPGDDHDRFGKTAFTDGLRVALGGIKDNQPLAPQGTRYYYAGFSSAVLGLVAEQITGVNLAKYIEGNLWKPLGTEAVATWSEDVKGSTMAYCCLLARPRDWLRLSIVLANDGRRPDTGAEVIPKSFIEDTIDDRRLDPPFKPRTDSWGYENQFWIGGKPTREYGLVGVRGQTIFISQKLKLVMVQFAVNASAHMNETSMGSQRTAFWRALVKYFDK